MVTNLKSRIETFLREVLSEMSANTDAFFENMLAASNEFAAAILSRPFTVILPPFLDLQLYFGAVVSAIENAVQRFSVTLIIAGVRTLISTWDFDWKPQWKVVTVATAWRGVVRVIAEGGIEAMRNPFGTLGNQLQLILAAKAIKKLEELLRGNILKVLISPGGTLIRWAVRLLFALWQIAVGIGVVVMLMWVAGQMESEETRERWIPTLQQKTKRKKWYAVRGRRPQKVGKNVERYTRHNVIRRRDPGGNKP